MTKRLVLVLMLFVMAPVVVTAATAQSEPKQQVVVEVSPIEPCVMIDKHGSYSGFEIELWEELARRLNLQYRYQTASSFGAALADTRAGTVDVAIAGISITQEREAHGIDFSHRDLASGLGILIRDEPLTSFFDSLRILISPEVWKVIGLFFLVLIIGGHVIWWADWGETNIPDEYFPGIIDAIWFAFATVSTTGYGDFTTRKTRARFCAILLWIFGSLVAAFLVGTISSEMTVQRLQYAITAPSDLQGKKVATLKDATSVAVLEQLEAGVVTTETIEEAYELLRKRDVSAVVYDQPALRYYALNGGKGKCVVVDGMFARQDYGFAFPEGSPLREPVNRELLRLQEDGGYDRLHEKYFGKQ